MPATTIRARVADLAHYNSVGWPHPYSTTLSGFVAAKAAGLWGVIHKATEGRTVRDAPMPKRRVAAIDAGLLWGTYHFIRPGNIAQQAEFYLTTAMPADSDLMALDWEDNGVSAAAARQWLEIVAQKTGRKPVLYSGNTAKELIRTRDPFFGSHRLWLAQYASRPTVQKSWRSFWLWQYTDGKHGPTPHSVPGLWLGSQPGVDLNHYAGTLEQLHQEWAGD